MKNKRVAIIILAIAGFVNGMVSAEWNTVSQPVCGEDCAGMRFVKSLEISVFFSIIFCFIGYFLKSWKSFVRLIVTGFVLSAITILSCYIIYINTAQYKKDKLSYEIFVDQDYSAVVISEEMIPLLNIVKGERCSLAYQYCDDIPRNIEAHCRAGIVYITEPYWKSFRRLPEEDYKGIDLPHLRNFPKNVCSTVDEGFNTIPMHEKSIS